MPHTRKENAWKYFVRHRVYDNPIFEGLVRSCASLGRMLLHIIVRDMCTWVPVQGVAIEYKDEAVKYGWRSANKLDLVIKNSFG